MPTWNEIDKEIDLIGATNAADQVREKYLKALSDLTGRVTIAYYSGWLQQPKPHPALSITDHDMNGFMAAVHNMDCNKGLDLILHTPSGDIESTRAIVGYIHINFKKDIRFFVPQIAMSAGTMVSCAANTIIMGKQSSLGPMDPQLSGFPALGVIKTYDKALEEMGKSQAHIIIWQTLFSKMPVTFITDCQRAVENTKDMVREWLESGMLSGLAEAKEKSASIVECLMDYERITSHSHHFSSDQCKRFGLNVEMMEDNQKFQEAILSVHHAYMATFARSATLKLIENHEGQRWAISSPPPLS